MEEWIFRAFYPKGIDQLMFKYIYRYMPNCIDPNIMSPRYSKLASKFSKLSGPLVYAYRTLLKTFHITRSECNKLSLL